MDRQTPVKTISSQNSFAGGNNGKSKRVHDCNFTPFVGKVLLSVGDRGSYFFSSQEIHRLFQYLCDFPQAQKCIYYLINEVTKSS